MSDLPGVSVVVPVHHADLEHLQAFLSSRVAAPLREIEATDVGRRAVEVVVAVPREEWGRFARLRAEHPGVRWVSADHGRGSQMNAGAAVASGQWLVFVHADCRLPDGWDTAISRLPVDADEVGGYFRFALDDDDWRARVIEFGARVRVCLFGLPYGDQALVVRRSVFEAMGGYRDLPIMEDVDLVGRLKKRGRLVALPLSVVTSARRWHQDGWLRRTWGNAVLISLYGLGVSPHRLARRYHRPGPVVVAMMARAPGTRGKSRLAPDVEPAEHEQLRHALFDDTLDRLRPVQHATLAVVCEPPGAVDEIQARVGASIQVIPQRAGDLGTRLHGVADDVTKRGASGVVIVGSDLPDLPPVFVQQAVDSLRRPDDRLVLGPASDGGYYLIGLRTPRTELFRGIDWGTPRVLQQTLQRARELGLEVVTLPEWADVDDGRDLQRLQAGASPGAVRTRAWLVAHAERRDGSTPRS